MKSELKRIYYDQNMFSGSCLRRVTFALRIDHNK